MKITRATFKSFVNKNKDKLFINVKSAFDGMTDCCESLHDGFQKAQAKDYSDYTMGIAGVWLVGQSRDYYQEYEDKGLKGIRVDNCCGSFIVAVEI